VAGTPPAAVERLNEVINETMRIPEVSRKLTEAGFIRVERIPSRQADDFARAEHDEWGTILRSFNIRLD
jgi:tripartite-type tricarboxylate transporter receptor subunit TctC